MEISYVWFDHLIRTTEKGKQLIEEVEKSLDEHNFEKFLELKDFLNSMFEDIIFLPNYGFVYDESDDVTLIDITIKENFDNISQHEYECG